MDSSSPQGFGKGNKRVLANAEDQDNRKKSHKKTPLGGAKPRVAACAVCDEDFMRKHPAEKKCQTCRINIKTNSTNNVQPMSESESDWKTIAFFCQTCGASFTRGHPAEKRCNNCRFPDLQEMEDDQISDDDSDPEPASNEQDEEMKKKDQELRAQADKIKTLEHEIVQLKLFIADHFIQTSKNPNQPSQTKTRRTAPYQASMNLPLENETPARTYADSVKSKPKSKGFTYAVVIKPNTPSTDKIADKQVNEIRRKIEKSLKPEETNFNVLNFKATESGQMIALLPTKEQQSNALKTFAEKGAQLGFSVEEPRKILPRIKIWNIPADLAPEEIPSEIIAANPEIKLALEDSNNNIRLVTTLKTKSDSYINAILEVSQAIRNGIMYRKSIKLGMCIYNVTNHVHIPQCQKCQKFGHRAYGPYACRAVKPVCGLCCGDHLTDECKGYVPYGGSQQAEQVKKRCANCKSESHGAIEKRDCKLYHKAKSDAFLRINISNDN